jgi:hypothetical protein
MDGLEGGGTRVERGGTCAVRKLEGLVRGPADSARYVCMGTAAEIGEMAMKMAVYS